MKIDYRWIRDPFHLVFAVLALTGMVFLATNCARIWTFTVDDAFITFRYSANLARGFGPTFNQVSPRAEGYTSFLWMLVMTIPHLLRFGMLSFAKALGVAATVGTMAWMAIFLERAGRPEERRIRLAAAGLVILLFGMLPETAVHAVSGMETAGYSFLFTGLVTLAYLGVTGRRWAIRWLPLAALLVGMIRPEANLPAAVVLGTTFFCLDKPQRKRFLLQILSLYVLPAAIYFGWRWRFYGVLLPLPFYIKTGGSGLPGLPIVGPFVIFLLANLGLYAGLGLLGEHRAVRLILLAVLPNLGFFLFSYPIMNYDHRFVYPLLPLLLVLAGMGQSILLARAADWARNNRAGWLVQVWMGLLILAVFAGQNMPRAQVNFDSKLDYARSMAQAHYTIGHTLNGVTHGSKAPVLVVTDAGAIPYISEWYTIDAAGLNDPNIALERVQVETYIFEHDPEVVVLTSTDAAEFANDSPIARDLFRIALSHGLIVVARSLFYQESTITIWILARPDGEAAQKLKAAFEDTME
jgi:arabinofuranosyltransferase